MTNIQDAREQPVLISKTNDQENLQLNKKKEKEKKKGTDILFGMLTVF